MNWKELDLKVQEAEKADGNLADNCDNIEHGHL